MIGAGLASTSSLAAASAVRHAEPIATMNIFDKKWAQADLEHLGIPKSWWHVHQGLFPFGPERVLVIRERPEDWGFRALKERLLQRRFGVAEETLDYILWITHMLTAYYHVPDYFERWATHLQSRESLGAAMGLYKNLGVVHQFQGGDGFQSTPTTNGLLDWWLFLLPEGVNFHSLDGQPTHVLFGLVIADPARDSGVLTNWGGCVLKLNEDWVAVSRMDRLAAARYLNRRLVDGMNRWDSSY